jgi:hypothetical protein
MLAHRFCGTLGVSVCNEIDNSNRASDALSPSRGQGDAQGTIHEVNMVVRLVDQQFDDLEDCLVFRGLGHGDVKPEIVFVICVAG